MSVRVKLIFPCPGNICPRNENIRWCHAICLTQLYINSNGIIFCDECSSTFTIAQAAFHCRNVNHQGGYVKFTMANFFHALSQFQSSLDAEISSQTKRQTFLNQFLMNTKNLKFSR